jgi:HD-GYP domain-containing protein (c-di-GMP phosphodiesterase class II)
MTTTTARQPASTDPRPDGPRRWRSRAGLARLVRVGVRVVPVLASLAVVALVTRDLPDAVPADPLLARWAVLAAMAAVVVLVVERATRRLLPLAGLLELELAFPGEPPSRLALVLGQGTEPERRERAARVLRDGLGDDPGAAARTALDLVAALDVHDRRVPGHAHRVRAYAQLIAEQLGLDAEERDRLAWAALLHDVGKLDVPAAILSTERGITEEWEAVRRHPETGAQLVAPLATWLGESWRAVREHHERMDGHGYPDGLPGPRITRAARIVAVADAYDVMTALRTYATPRSAQEARAELTRLAGPQFDPEVVRALLAVPRRRVRAVAGALAWLAGLAAFRSAPPGRVPRVVGALAAAASVAVSVVAGVGLAAAGPAGGLAGAHAAADGTPPWSTEGLAPAPTVPTSAPSPTIAAATAATAATTATTGSTASTAAAPPTAPPPTDPSTTTTVPETTTTAAEPPPPPETTPPRDTAPEPAPTASPTAPPPPPTAPPPPPTAPTTSAAGNRPPVAIDDVLVIHALPSVVKIDARANDFDPDGDTFLVVGVTQPVNGTVFVQDNYKLVLTVPEKTPGTWAFTYTVVDTRGATSQAGVSVTLTAPLE